MTSIKQVEANRRNALQSTGPKTSAGKAVSAKNAIRHGALATMAIPIFETEAEWEEHRAAVVASLYPEGFLETELAERVAFCLWRLKRVARAEREVITVGQETVEEAYLAANRFSTPKPEKLEDACMQAKVAKNRQRLLERLPRQADEAPVARADASTILWAVTGAVEDEEFDLDELTLPDISDDAALEEFPNWTAGLVRRCIAAIAVHDEQTPEALLDAATWRARGEALQQDRQVKEIATAVDRLRRERLLPDEQTLSKLSRYEAALERSLYKALHQLERLQAARTGQAVPPPIAVDVDVVASEGA
jgi:hypothetical protein